MKGSKNYNIALNEAVEKLENKIRQAHQDLGYARARMRAAEDRIRYYEKQLLDLAGKPKK